jgi:hypothetical protein
MFEATSWVTSASRDDDGTSDVDRMNAERLLSTTSRRSRSSKRPLIAAFPLSPNRGHFDDPGVTAS